MRLEAIIAAGWKPARRGSAGTLAGGAEAPQPPPGGCWGGTNSVGSFIRGILQYQDVDRNPALYDFPVSASSEQLFSQLLFSYKLNPQTVFFLGYSDTHLGVGQIDLTQTDRTFFAKIGYAWIF
jgi:hypothetical protein